MFGVIYVSYLPGVLPCAVCFLARAAWLTSRESLAHCCCFKIFMCLFMQLHWILVAECGLLSCGSCP